MEEKEIESKVQYQQIGSWMTRLCIWTKGVVSSLTIKYHFLKDHMQTEREKWRIVEETSEPKCLNFNQTEL